MRCFSIVFLVLIFSSVSVFSQGNYTKHIVSKGETIGKIAHKYDVTTKEIYDLNPKVKKSIQKNTVLLIPIKGKASISKTSKLESSNSEIIHEVLPKETLYSIAKQYGTSVLNLQSANAVLDTEALAVGQKIIIPIANQSGLSDLIKTEGQAEVNFIHEVLPKETKFGIAKEYGISVKELERQNPEIERNLSAGAMLKISSSKLIEKEEIVEKVAHDNSIDKPSVDTVYDDAFVDQLISSASENIGTRYLIGGTSKKGFDCSGLLYTTFGDFDIKLPRTSIEMSRYGEKVDAEDAQKGDLIFFKTSGKKQINHVGMVVEVNDDEIKFIHSSSHGVMISSTKESYYKKNMAQVNRVL